MPVFYTKIITYTGKQKTHSISNEVNLTGANLVTSDYPMGDRHNSPKV